MVCPTFWHLHVVLRIPKGPNAGNPVNFEIELRHRTDCFYNRVLILTSKCCGWDIRTDQRVGQQLTASPIRRTRDRGGNDNDGIGVAWE
jgi:hypothetical protein